MTFITNNSVPYCFYVFFILCVFYTSTKCYADEMQSCVIIKHLNDHNKTQGYVQIQPYTKANIWIPYTSSITLQVIQH